MSCVSKVFNIDCLEYMKTCKDKEFDLAIVDPPYGIKESGSKNQSRRKFAVSKKYKSYKGDDLEPPPPEYFVELKRISKNQIIFGANHFIDLMPFRSSGWIVWDKLNGDTDFADCELAYTSFDCAVRKFSFRWQGMLQGNMKNKEIRIHPNQKPVAIYKWILSKFAKKGDKIIDTHLGSGSNRIACYDLGFDFYGCEWDEYYFDLQEKRFKEHCLQGNLFEYAGGEIKE